MHTWIVTSTVGWNSANQEQARIEHWPMGFITEFHGSDVRGKQDS